MMQANKHEIVYSLVVIELRQTGFSHEANHFKFHKRIHSFRTGRTVIPAERLPCLALITRKLIKLNVRAFCRRSEVPKVEEHRCWFSGL
jgi:hypothetical protein